MKTGLFKALGGLSGQTRKAVMAMALLVGGCALQSCGDDDDSFPVYPINRPNAIVTIKQTADGSSFYMQLDDSTRVTATNLTAAPYGNKEVRALTNFRLLENPVGKRQYAVYVNWVDSVLTKPMAVNHGLLNAQKYGTDPVELLRDWTVTEDGYLTVHFRTQWSAASKPHMVNLVRTGVVDPYDVTFYHNADGVKGGYWGDGIVAFRLDRLPDTNGKTVDMTLHWMSFSGERSVTFHYCSRKSSGVIDGLSSAASGQFEKSLK